MKLIKFLTILILICSAVSHKMSHKQLFDAIEESNNKESLVDNAADRSSLFDDDISLIQKSEKSKTNTESKSNSLFGNSAEKVQTVETSLFGNQEKEQKVQESSLFGNLENVLGFLENCFVL